MKLRRYEQAVKRSINKAFQSRDAVNLDIAKVICGFSHRSTLKPGEILKVPSDIFYLRFGYRDVENTLVFKVVDVISPHRVRGAFCFPDQSSLHMLCYKPLLQTKIIYSPFGSPSIKSQNLHYYPKH